MEPHRVGRRHQFQLLAAQDEFPHQHADGIFVLPGPLDDRRYQSAAMLAHDPRRRLASRLAVSKDGAQVGVIEVGKVTRIELPPGGVVVGQRLTQLSRLGDAAAAPDGRRSARHLPHQRVHVFQLLQRLPAAVALAPLIRRRGHPDGERLGEVLVGVRLRVPVGEVPYEASAVGTRPVGFRRILRIGTAEYALPLLARGEMIGMIDGMAALVPQQHLAPFRCSSLHFQHLAQFKRLEPWMREIKREGDGRHAGWRKPLVAKVTIGPHSDSARGQLVVKLPDSRLQFAPFDADPQIANTERKQFLVFEPNPGGIGSHFH